ncbi:MAG: heparan-alpha-glucosaminide N-acetyltransferase domain-containing protein [Chloroflexota bacterium]
MSDTVKKRLNFVDVARSFAIFLAIFSHAMIDFGGWDLLSSDQLLIRVISRSATPLFIFMFGMMLELVYFKRYEQQGLQPISQRLVKRSFQCFVGYQLTVLAGLIGGSLTPLHATAAALFLADAHFGNILRFYSIALLLAIPLLVFRQRYKSLGMIGLLVGIWLTYPILTALNITNLSVFSGLGGVLFGVVGNNHGPSVLYGFTFLIAGMLVASSLDNWREQGFGAFYRMSAVVLGVCGAIVATLVVSSSAFEVVQNFVTMEAYRAQNHPGYYAIGLFLCMCILIALSFLVPLHRSLPQWSAVPMEFGRSSLTAYTMGNVVLNLLPAFVVGTTVAMAIGMSIGYLIILLVLLHGYNIALERVRPHFQRYVDKFTYQQQAHPPSPAARVVRYLLG